MNIKEYENKKVRIITTNGWTYIGKILSSGEDYVNILDKYGAKRFLKLDFISMIEEVSE